VVKRFDPMASMAAPPWWRLALVRTGIMRKRARKGKASGVAYRPAGR